MLLWVSRGEGGEVGEQGLVDLADEVALDAADDRFFAESLAGAFVDVGAGAWVVAHPAQGHGVQRVVGGPVAAAVQPVPVGASGADRYWGGAAQAGQGGLGP